MTYLSDTWSATDFRAAEITSYAEEMMCTDTRHGVQVMALLSLLMQLCVPLFVLKLGIGSTQVYTYMLLGLLSLHVLISANFVTDIRALQFLGMVLLLVSALAITFLAHRTGTLHIGMMAAVVMLFIAMPLVPWGLREAVTIIALTYVLLTSSLVSIPGRFDAASLWTLQMLILGTSLIVTVVVARNAYARKQDIRTRFQLEQARRAMEMLSLKDPLTGAWNRRYLDTRFAAIATTSRRKGKTLHVAVLDIDDFKIINDTCGHHHADEILECLGEVFTRHLGNDGYFVRLGGDEFQILYTGNGLRGVIDAAIEELQSRLPIAAATGMDAITLSAGFTSAAPGEHADLDQLYKAADKALYVAKQSRPSTHKPLPAPVPQYATGTWKL